MSTANCTFLDDFFIVVVGNPLSPLSKSRHLGELLGELLGERLGERMGERLGERMDEDPLRQGGSGGSDTDSSLFGAVARRMSIGSFSSSR